VVVAGGRTGFREPVASVLVVIPDGIIGAIDVLPARKVVLPFVARVDAPGLFMVSYLRTRAGAGGGGPADGPKATLVASALVTVTNRDGCGATAR
jgi:hypothetical protein